ncbi:hypothetical protein BRN52_15180 [Xanthomonas oryzae pv. oryzae]|uniref:hypothetical protein n=1 Tax=Xanthomonas oryzae TaxID=347 RepID=UPI0005CF249E|nr:hypothetical protein [Xanthomonas oryzae]AJQ83761.1 hypothetical protein AZ54_15130 [Xanthomonas oryzae pv. oryzae PXO86]ALZ72464.1 hypothetical protein APZ20_14185 [Xanthomonas oryzae pv. oryzae]AOS05557.1 hypothetical protein ATY43_04775 [Xanthomonas oryzae pv. oryzae]AOS11273.1 hypothetical protein ATY44_14310 [Xanthomonas oryzae pv. oryzae]AXM32865.1 hypothetical protein BRN52_15180 [Xanthomonas oryzae pv. oryzae]
MNPLPARRHVRARLRIGLSGALALRRHALAFCAHRNAPAAIIGPPQPQLRTRAFAAFTRRALELRAADRRTTPRALP